MGLVGQTCRVVPPGQNCLDRIGRRGLPGKGYRIREPGQGTMEKTARSKSQDRTTRKGKPEKTIKTVYAIFPFLSSLSFPHCLCSYVQNTQNRNKKQENALNFDIVARHREQEDPGLT
jgi:hypothetical protein